MDIKIYIEIIFRKKKTHTHVHIYSTALVVWVTKNTYYTLKEKYLIFKQNK